MFFSTCKLKLQNFVFGMFGFPGSLKHKQSNQPSWREAELISTSSSSLSSTEDLRTLWAGIAFLFGLLPFTKMKSTR